MIMQPRKKELNAKVPHPIAPGVLELKRANRQKMKKTLFPDEFFLLSSVFIKHVGIFSR